MSRDKAYKIYSGDYSKDGYDQGIEDSKQHISKNKFKFFKAVNPINYIWNFNNAYNSFAQNYDRGYLDGQRVNHNVYNSNQGGSMRVDSYEDLLRVLEETKANMISLINPLQIMVDRYQKQIELAQSAGFMSNIVERLKSKQNIFSKKIDDAVALIKRHEQTIEKHKEKIEYLKQQAESED